MQGLKYFVREAMVSLWRGRRAALLSVATIAAALDLPRRSVRVVHGDTSRNKTIEITGIDPAAARARLVK